MPARRLRSEQVTDLTARRTLLTEVRWELVPIKSVDDAIAALPPGAAVSVTCSPTKGLQHTLDLTARLVDAGHDVVPHLAARLVEDRHHVTELAAWCRRHGVREVFLVGGDAAAPSGPYGAVLPFLRELLEHEPGLTAVGVAGYPDGHPAIVTATLDEALVAKQSLLAEAGITGSISTQMCFDASRTVRWLGEQRRRGVTLPVRLGVPGAVDRARLLSLGTRLGIGASLRYLRKNRSVVTRLATPGGYDPLGLIDQVAGSAATLGVCGLHVFTFNAMAATLQWWHDALDGPVPTTNGHRRRARMTNAG